VSSGQPSLGHLFVSSDFWSVAFDFWSAASDDAIEALSCGLERTPGLCENRKAYLPVDEGLVNTLRQSRPNS
jgi:hypothetical protein